MESKLLPDGRKVDVGATLQQDSRKYKFQTSLKDSRSKSEEEVNVTNSTNSMEQGPDTTVATATAKESRKLEDQLMIDQGYKQCDLPDRDTEFRVCVSIHEARNLEGVDCNPLLRVACRCGQQIKKTRSSRGSINPKFNEVKNFTFTCLPMKMMEKTMELKVLNVKQLLHDSMVGFFTMELGVVYSQPGHSYAKKWLMLVDANHGGCYTKGYLKVSIQVIGPGDSVHPLHSLVCSAQDEAEDENLLDIVCPTGASLALGKLIVRVYKGEDFPQLDSRKLSLRKSSVVEELVDPYCVVSYGGHKAKTPVINNNYDPEWNYEISLPFQLPFMSERITFKVKDEDRGSSDDYIGTFFLNLSQLSASGDSGFAPTFGPCYVNIYGSHREYSKLDELKSLNKGQFEGVAYRGRILVEVSCDLDHALSTPKGEKMSHPPRIEPQQVYIEYTLFGVLISATMIHPHDKPIEFEVSLGISGYTLDDQSSLSSTPPMKPVCNTSGRCTCYSLPLTNQKPCIEVNSVWEDCSHRIEALNTLLHITHELEENLNAAKKHFDSEEFKGATDKLDELLQSLLDNTSQYPEHSPGNHPNTNNLDMKMRNFRQNELESMKEDIKSTKWNLMESFTEGPGDQVESLNQIIKKTEDYLVKLKGFCYEPQNSIPDVIIWMLSGKKRVAVKRIPSHEIMYAKMGKARGKNCGKIQTITLVPPRLKIQDHKRKDKAQISMLLWLGSRKDYKEIPQLGGELTTHMEIYEYEKKDHKVFKTEKWVDVRGRKIEDDHPKQNLVPPINWKWGEDWKPIPPQEDISEEAQESVYEYHNEEESFWGNENGERLCIESQGPHQGTKDDIACPDGWRWNSDWVINGGKSKKDGWMYASCIECTETTKWEPKKKRTHKTQRRNWIRVRITTQSQQDEAKLVFSPPKTSSEVYWEYGQKSDHNRSFHAVRSSYDSCRRRHWTRKLVYVYEDTGKSSYKQKNTNKTKNLNIPLQKTLNFSDCHLFQFRAYIYQARDLFSGDKSGLSDPYAVISFNNFSDATRVIYKTRCPVWNQTIMEDNIELYGSRPFIKEQVSPVNVELWDRDTFKDDYLGQLQVTPILHWDLNDPQLKLQWYKIDRFGEYAGELLAGFELFHEDELPYRPPMNNGPVKYRLILPPISPRLAKFNVQFMCWGVRNLKRFHGLRVNPLVEVECGARDDPIVIQPPREINDRKNANFSDKLVTFNVNIPMNSEYAPPLIIKVFTKRGFRRVLVGSSVTKSVKPFIVSPPVQDSVALTHVVPPQTERLKLKREVTSEFDWWSKYYHSTGEESKVQEGYIATQTRLRIYNKELEAVFHNFTDFLQPFHLFRGKGSHNDPDDHVGYIKGSIKMYCTQEEGEPEQGVYNLFKTIPSNSPLEIIVRVYVVKGIQLAPKDIRGSSDPYLTVAIGNVQKTTKDQYIANDLNPLFGSMFELPATLPYDHTLTVSVMDWDKFTRDDLIGTTKIDVENRFYSKYRATCGLPEAVLESGANKWRDVADPMEILYDWVSKEGLPEPKWTEDCKQVTIGTVQYFLKDFEDEKKLPIEVTGNHQQRLALHILLQKELVHEHIETRNLYNPMHPGIKQGQLHMWVDIFQKSNFIRPPVDISPRKPVMCELRVVVWNTKDVLLDEKSFVTGEDMSDIYVKGWLQDKRKMQKTDVHYRSLDGTGNFNWRFVFPMEYIPAENVIISRRKDHVYSMTKTEYREDPEFTIEIWDNDIFTPDDFLGNIKFDLSKMPYSKRQEKINKEEGKLNLMKMESKSIKGWWKVHYVNKRSERIESGEIELELEVVTKEEAQKNPVGRGRDEPNVHPYLPKPTRPDTSFLWLTSPLKSLYHIIWKHHHWKIIITAATIIIIIIVIVIIVTVPQTVIKSLTDHFTP